MQGRPELLALFDALVHETPAPRLVGTISIGVGRPGRVDWWHVTFERGRARTGWGRRRDSAAQVTWLLGASDAEALLRPNPSPLRLNRIEGDRVLLSRFLRRYATRTSWLEVRKAAS